MNPNDALWTALIAWYRGAGRDLPWRGSHDPWVVLVSEVMSQQTQAARVATRLPPFLNTFPVPAALAVASRQDVLAAWTGLGYNRRAIRLQDAARVIEADGWPTSSADLLRLPGVGKYTAAAVACFAFGEQVPAIDINVRRVVSRWSGRELTEAETRRLATELLPHDEAHHWAQSLMDLGAAICTASNPSCSMCPCEPWCDGADVAVRSSRQSRFEGSVRQARGLIIKHLAQGGDVDLDALTAVATPERLLEAANALADEGLVDFDGTTVSLRDDPLDSQAGPG